MLKLGEQLYLRMIINKQEVPLNYMGIDALQLHSSASFFQPMGSVVLIDKAEFFQKYPIVDGVTVDIYAGRTQDDKTAYVYRYRLYTHSVTKVGSYNYYTLKLTFNCPRYFNENSKGAYKGSSNTVLSTLATECGLGYDGYVNVNDSQTWYPGGHKRCLFAKELVTHAYSTDSSCMVHGVTLTGTLRYRDLAQVNVTTTNNIVVRGLPASTGKYIRGVGHKEVNKSGFLNNLAVYGLTTVAQTANTNTPTNYSAVSLKLNTANNVNVNPQIQQNISGSRVQFSPVSNGNVHSNYYKAQHQNLRIKQTYSLALHLAVDNMTGLDLFDPIYYHYTDLVNNEAVVNKLVSGGYIITAKTIFVTKEGRYYEKFEVVRQGYNYDSSVVVK